MTMGWTAAAVMVAGAAYSADKGRSAANKQADAMKAAADQATADAKRLADQQKAQAEKAQADAVAAEMRRRQAEAAADAEQRRIAADASNAQLADNTPKVQIGEGAATGVTDARKRRAEFRPEYSSGITI